MRERRGALPWRRCREIGAAGGDKRVVAGRERRGTPGRKRGRRRHRCAARGGARRPDPGLVRRCLAEAPRHRFRDETGAAAIDAGWRRPPRRSPGRRYVWMAAAGGPAARRDGPAAPGHVQLVNELIGEASCSTSTCSRPSFAKARQSATSASLSKVPSASPVAISITFHVGSGKLRLSVSQPLRVERGRAWLSLPAGRTGQGGVNLQPGAGRPGAQRPAVGLRRAMARAAGRGRASPGCRPEPPARPSPGHGPGVDLTRRLAPGVLTRGGATCPHNPGRPPCRCLFVPSLSRPGERLGPALFQQQNGSPNCELAQPDRRRRDGKWLRS